MPGDFEVSCGGVVRDCCVFLVLACPALFHVSCYNNARVAKATYTVHSFILTKHRLKLAIHLSAGSSLLSSQSVHAQLKTTKCKKAVHAYIM